MQVSMGEWPVAAITWLQQVFTNEAAVAFRLHTRYALRRSASNLKLGRVELEMAFAILSN